MAGPQAGPKGVAVAVTPVTGWTQVPLAEVTQPPYQTAGVMVAPTSLIQYLIETFESGIGALLMLVTLK